jgi:hypothetical protein
MVHRRPGRRQGIYAAQGRRLSTLNLAGKDVKRGCVFQTGKDNLREKEATGMAAWEYRVAYVDFRGRVSIEGQEIMMEQGERRSAFVRTVLDHIGKDGWELAGVHPLWPAETSYMIFKRPSTGETDTTSSADKQGDAASSGTEPSGEPTRDIKGEASEMV